MTQFTQEELIQYLYNESSAEKRAQIDAALASDWNLREELETLRVSQKALNEVKLLSPRSKTIEDIMRYAEKALEVPSHA